MRKGKSGRAKGPGPTVKPERKNIRLSAERYVGRQMYFFTLCFFGRRRLGVERDVAVWLVGALRECATKCEFAIHAYCVMPDHMHFLADGIAESSNAVKLVESFKQETAFRFDGQGRERLWQFKYYDHILRAKDSPDAVAWYIWMNPVRKDLCGKPGEYAYLGAFSQIGMKMLNSGACVLWEPPWKGKGQGRDKDTSKGRSGRAEGSLRSPRPTRKDKGGRAEDPGPTVKPNA